MKLLSLRFGEKFAPKCGTIAAHTEIINKYGFVWYGKFGNTISDRILKEIMAEPDPRILLIKSGTQDRYWAHISEYKKVKPDQKECIPSYYREDSTRVKVWFKIVKIERAPSDIMSKCRIISSGALLSLSSRSSMNPCAFVNYDPNNDAPV